MSVSVCVCVSERMPCLYLVSSSKKHFVLRRRGVVASRHRAYHALAAEIFTSLNISISFYHGRGLPFPDWKGPEDSYDRISLLGVVHYLFFFLL